MNQRNGYPYIITETVIQREFMRLIGETDSKLISVTLRQEAFDMAADVVVRGKLFTIEFEAKELVGDVLDDFSDHYIAPAILTMGLK